jgi:hypothetical protein
MEFTTSLETSKAQKDVERAVKVACKNKTEEIGSERKITDCQIMNCMSLYKQLLLI